MSTKSASTMEELLGFRERYQKWKTNTENSDPFMKALRGLEKEAARVGHDKDHLRSLWDLLLWNCYCAKFWPDWGPDLRRFAKDAKEAARHGLSLLEELRSIYLRKPYFNLPVRSLIVTVVDQQADDDEDASDDETHPKASECIDILARSLHEVLSGAPFRNSLFVLRSGPLEYEAGITWRTRLPERPASLMVVSTLLLRSWTAKRPLPDPDEAIVMPRFGRPNYNIVGDLISGTFDRNYQPDDVKNTVKRIVPQVKIKLWPSQHGVISLLANELRPKRD